MSNATNNLYKSVVPTKNATTPQSQPIPGREAEMVSNYAGGVVFKLDKWKVLDRFLILGTEKASYYASAQKLTKDAASNVLALIAKDPVAIVKRVIEISDAGRAPKNDSAIFVLALVASSPNPIAREKAFEALPKVCRTGTHLFQFVDLYHAMGKWNAAAKRGISNWYNSKEVSKLAYGMLKYQQRNGWSHRDVLRLAHVKPHRAELTALYGWVTAKDNEVKFAKMLEAPKIIEWYVALHKDRSKTVALEAIREFNMSHEMMPTELLKDPDIWEALLPGMGYTALLRNLGRMSSIGMVKPLSKSLKAIVEKLSDVEALKRGRVHPITVLNALKTYSQGRGDKGSLTWTVAPQIVSVLNKMFYEAFNFIEPTGKNFLIGIDCSGSMWGAKVNGLNNLCAAEVAAVTALAIAKREHNYHIVGFDTSVSPLSISPDMTLEQVLNTMRKFKWGGTDCAQPMIYATKHKLDVDCFITITDNETWAGKIHPTQALRDFRKVMNKPNACNAVLGTSATNFTVADPKDPRQIDIVGFDSAVPQLIAEFVNGTL